MFCGFSLKFCLIIKFEIFLFYRIDWKIKIKSEYINFVIFWRIVDVFDNFEVLLRRVLKNENDIILMFMVGG